MVRMSGTWGLHLTIIVLLVITLFYLALNYFKKQMKYNFFVEGFSFFSFLLFVFHGVVGRLGGEGPLSSPAPLPNAMIKNNNIDNSVPSTKQWTEIPTSVLLEI